MKAAARVRQKCPFPIYPCTLSSSQDRRYIILHAESVSSMIRVDLPRSGRPRDSASGITLTIGRLTLGNGMLSLSA